MDTKNTTQQAAVRLEMAIDNGPESLDRFEVYDAAQDLLAALQAEGREAGRRDAVPEWLPIETAPRDGRTMILLLTPSNWPQVAWSNTWWTAGFSVECKPRAWAPMPQLAAQQEKSDG